jgi:hypothetical protein
MKAYNIDTNAKAQFFDSLFRELNKYPFGSMPKRDLDCLLLHLMRESGVISGANRDMANSLGINEQRLKSYILDGRYKYGEDKKAENIQTIIEGMKQGSIKLDNEDGKYTFVLDDPIQRDDFSQALKDIGYFDDTSFNRELVKVKDYALFAFLMANRKAETQDGLYKALSGKTGIAIQDMKKNLNENSTVLDKAKSIMKVIGKNISPPDLIQTVLIALPLVVKLL